MKVIRNHIGELEQQNPDMSGPVGKKKDKSIWKKKKCGPVQHTGPYFLCLPPSHDENDIQR